MFDVLRPYRQSKLDAMLAMGDSVVVFGSRFIGNCMLRPSHRFIPGLPAEANGRGKDIAYRTVPTP